MYDYPSQFCGSVGLGWVCLPWGVSCGYSQMVAGAGVIQKLDRAGFQDGFFRHMSNASFEILELLGAAQQSLPLYAASLRG